MKNKVLDDIKKYAAQRLESEYGFCGVADMPGSAHINSGYDFDGIDMSISVKIEEIHQPEYQNSVQAAAGGMAQTAIER